MWYREKRNGYKVFVGTLEGNNVVSKTWVYMGR